MEPFVVADFAAFAVGFESFVGLQRYFQSAYLLDFAGWVVFPVVLMFVAVADLVVDWTVVDAAAAIFAEIAAAFALEEPLEA